MTVVIWKVKKIIIYYQTHLMQKLETVLCVLKKKKAKQRDLFKLEFAII